MMDLIANVKLRMIDCFAAENPDQIAHTLCVHSYARLIASLESLPPRRVELIEVAALLHDIGCPAARAKYGDSKPPHQETEGAALARKLLENEPRLAAGEAGWVAEVVGSHHRRNPMILLHAEPLFDADLIVNLFEGYFDRSRAGELRDAVCITGSGKSLMTKLFRL